MTTSRCDRCGKEITEINYLGITFAPNSWFRDICNDCKNDVFNLITDFLNAIPLVGGKDE